MRPREARDDAKKLLVCGTDPAAQKKAHRIVQTDTFKAIAEEWLRMQAGRLAEVTLDKEWFAYSASDLAS